MPVGHASMRRPMAIGSADLIGRESGKFRSLFRALVEISIRGEGGAPSPPNLDRAAARFLLPL
jgi:hypothetical protein